MTITRDGKPVARLVPAAVVEEPMPDHAAPVVERFRKLREALRAEGVQPFSTDEILGLIKSGRKY